MDETAILSQIQSRHNTLATSLTMCGVHFSSSSQFALLPKEVMLIVLSLLDRQTAIGARLVCRSWDRYLHLAPIHRVSLVPNFRPKHVLRFFTLFPSAKLFQIPEQSELPSSSEWSELYQKTKPRSIFDWSQISAIQRVNVLTALDCANAWQWIVDAATEWIQSLSRTKNEQTTTPITESFYYARRFTAFSSMNCFKEALADGELLCKRMPNTATIQYSCAMMCYRLGRYKDSLQYWTRAIELVKEHGEGPSVTTLPILYTNRAQTYIECSLYQKALEDIMQVAEPDTNTIQTKSQILMRLGRHREVIPLLESLLERDPLNGDTLNDIACAYLELRQFDKALTAIENALTVEPDDSDLNYNRARILFDMNRYEDALDGFNRSLSKKVRGAHGYYRRAKCYQKLQREAEAREDYLRILEMTQEKEPESEANWLARGNALMYFSRVPEAYECFTRALATRPSLSEAYYSRAKALLAKGLLEEALHDANKASEIRAVPEYFELKRSLESLLSLRQGNSH